MAIRLRVRERRQALRLSLVEVARRIGVSAAFLSQYETGKNNIGIENAKRLSIVLGIPVEELLESGVDKRPRWLDVLTERHDLSRSEQEALLSVARESPVYRGAAVLREEQKDVEHSEMDYQSIKPYLPKCGRSEDWINKSEIRNIAVGLGVPNASCLEDILCAVDKQVDKICEGIEFRNIDAFRTHMLSALGIRVERLYNDVDLTPLLREFAAMGLFRAISDCTLFARDVHAFGGTYAIKNCTGENRFLVLIDERNDKMWRSEFTLWHEMAHVIADPNVMLGTVATFDEANNNAYDQEWLMDCIAGRIAFWPKLFTPFYDRLERQGHVMLSYDGACQLRRIYNPAASKSMTAIAIADHANVPVVYLEAEMRSKRKSTTKELRLSCIHPNSMAEKVAIRFGKNMRVPQSSVIARVFAGPAEQEDVAQENLKEWSYSSGETLKECPVSIRAHHHKDSKGVDRVHAFVFVLESVDLKSWDF